MGTQKLSKYRKKNTHTHTHTAYCNKPFQQYNITSLFCLLIYSSSLWRKANKKINNIYVYVCVYIYTCVCIYVYIYIHTHTHTHTQQNMKFSKFYTQK